MATFLFDKIIFGPVKSRRLGTSLGINLLPVDHKICSFDCVYCECGFNPKEKDATIMPSRNKVYVMLEKKLKDMAAKEEEPDVITFAGNGEPTLHPEFGLIIKDTLLLRNKLCPDAKVAVLTNSLQAHNEDIYRALLSVDQNILKLDSGIESTLRIMNQPPKSFNMESLLKTFMKFRGELILQTMFLKGELNGQKFDNTSDDEIKALLDIYKQVNPTEIMIYSIERDTPVQTLLKIDKSVLTEIAKKIEDIGLKVTIS